MSNSSEAAKESISEINRNETRKLINQINKLESKINKETENMKNIGRKYQSNIQSNLVDMDPN